MTVGAESKLYIPEHLQQVGSLPSILRPRDVRNIDVSPNSVAAFQELLTAREILGKKVFPDPLIIDPIGFPTFDALLSRRNHVRDLQVLPFKEEHTRALYKEIPRGDLLRSIDSIFLDADLALAPNQYPSFLPDDVNQRVLWVRNQETESDTLAEFLARCMVKLNTSSDEVIFYERPRNGSRKPIGGTIPEYRHVHVWTRAETK